ncbi:MAG: AAA family ATPase [Lachnospiraceae bacterium]|nr:AAA family ATPase [Lachnospiraceae bacterium]
MMVSGSTRTIGLIGNPVEHTLSPVIHNGISDAMGIASVYVPFKVDSDGIGEAVKGAYELNILGLNVTVPHKNAVMASLVSIDEDALHIGAVNTLVRDEDKHGYVGYNTDMPGLLRQIKEDGISLKDRTVVVLGAGGASKAVVYMCLKEGADKIYLLNRTIDKAKKIADDMNEIAALGIVKDSKDTDASASKVEHVEKRDIVIPRSIKDYNKITENNLIVFQATSIGLSPNVDEVVIDDSEFYKKIDTGIDLIYNPAETKFMKLVKANGGKAYNALKMLLYQGVIAYELWHNVKVPDDIIADIYVELKRQVYPKDNIVLIGFMGSGKSTVGKALAKSLNMDFLDTDEYIEEKAGMTISDIFEKKGEEEFRRIETETLCELKESLANTIISTGGGMPLRSENARLLKETGKVFYLSASAGIIYDRVKDDTKRPLLMVDDPYGKICSMMKERKPLYEKACDYVIDTNSNDIDEIIEKIQIKVVEK